MLAVEVASVGRGPRQARKRGRAAAQWEWLLVGERAVYRQAFFPEDEQGWWVGDETTAEAVEAGHRFRWPVVQEQLLWLAVVQQAIEDAAHPDPERHEGARAFILSRGFRTCLNVVALRSPHEFNVGAIRAKLKRTWLTFEEAMMADSKEKKVPAAPVPPPVPAGHGKSKLGDLAAAVGVILPMLGTGFLPIVPSPEFKAALEQLRKAWEAAQ